MILSKRQFTVFFIAFIVYLLLGAFTFYTIESKEDEKNQENYDKMKQEVDDLITKYFPQNKQDILFSKISDYCEKPSGSYVPDDDDLSWTFYNALFFVLTIVSTIGYGNLAPSTTFTRIFMIVYGTIGVPISGIVWIAIGDYFANIFRHIYRKWKHINHVQYYSTFGYGIRLTGYFIPGLILLIVIPAAVLTYVENWTFDVGIEFAFGTLTTVGTGSTVLGSLQTDKEDLGSILYKTFIFVWVIVGLGYISMYFNFITEGILGQKMVALESKVTNNIKKTNKKIRQELRYLLNEYLFSQTYSQPIYRERRLNVVIKHKRALSCPDLFSVCDVTTTIVKKRTVSDLPYLPLILNHEIKSDSDLDDIGKIKVFEQNTTSQHNELISKVANILEHYNDLEVQNITTISSESSESTESDDSDYNYMFEKNVIVARNADQVVEAKNSTAIINFKSHSLRPLDYLDYKEHDKTRRNTLPVSPTHVQENMFTRFKRTIRKSFMEQSPNIEYKIFGQSKNNSLSDFFKRRSLCHLNERVEEENEQTNSTNKSLKVRRRPIIPALRRSSLDSVTSSQDIQRRHSEVYPTTSDDMKGNSSFKQRIFSPRCVKSKNFVVGMHKFKQTTCKVRNSVVISIEP